MQIQWNGVDVEEWALPLEIYSFRQGTISGIGIRILIFEWLIFREAA